MIGDMDTTKLLQALSAIAALMLAYALAVKISNGIKAKSMSKMAVAAAGIAAMVAPITILSKLDTISLIQGVAAVSVLIMLFGAMAALSADFKMRNALALVGVMFVLANVIKSITELLTGPISTISDSAITKYCIIAGSLFVFMGILLFSFDKIKKKTTSLKPKDANEVLKKIGLFAVVLSALVGVALLLMHAAKIIHTVDWAAFASGIGLFALVIGATFGIVEYAKRTYISNDTVKNLATISVILVSLTAVMFGIGFLAKSMGSLGENSVKVIGLVLSSLSLVLLAVFGLAALVKGTNDKTFKGILAITALFGAITLMMIGLAAAIKIINNSNVDGIAMLIVVATAVVTAFAMFVAASIFKEKIEECAKAMITLSIAFTLLGVGALAFAAAAYLMKSNVLGIVLVAGAMISLAVAAKILGSASPTLVTIAVAFAAMGMAVLAVGAAMYLIILSLEKMLPMLDELAAKGESLKVVVESVLQGILEGIANALPTITEKVITSLDILLSWIKQKLGELLDWFMNLDLSKIAKVIDKLVELLFTIVNSVLEALHKNIGTIVKKLIEIILSAIYALIEKLPDIAQALFDLVIGLIDAFGQALADNAERLRESIVNFAKNMWQAFLNFFGIHSPSKESESAAGNIIAGLVNGLMKGISKVVNCIIKLGSKMLKQILKLPKQFLKSGADIIKSFFNGLKSTVNVVLDFLSWLKDKILDFFTFGLYSEIKDSGKQVMVSYRDGMESVNDDASQTAKEVIDGVVDELSKTEYFKAIGESIIEYIVAGIEDNSIDITDAIVEALTDAVDQLDETYDELTDTLGSSGLDKFMDSLENAFFGSLAGVVNSINTNLLQPLTNGFDSSMKLFKTLGPNISREMDKVTRIIEAGNHVMDASENLLVRYTQDLSNQMVTDINGMSSALSTCMDSVTKVVELKWYAINKALYEGHDWLTNALADLKDLIDSELDFTDEELTIRPVMDISDIEEKTGQIAEMLYSVGSINVATATMNAEKASYEINAAKQTSEQVSSTTSTQLGTTDDQGGVYNVTFNITGNDPKAIADEVSKRFQQYTSRRNTAYGRGNI